MKRILKGAILTLALLPIVTNSLAAQETAGQPKAVVERAIEDLGTVNKGDTVPQEFVIRNDGDAPLEILEVRPTCGCTVATFDKVIAPGQSGRVVAELDTATLAGPTAKTIVILTNDPENPRFELVLKAEVKPFIAVHPGYARYIFYQGHEPGTVTQWLWAVDGEDLEIQSVESPYPYLTVSFKEAEEGERWEGGPDRQWRVETTLASDAAVGPLADYVVVRTNHVKQKVVTIPVSGFVRPMIAVTPPIADFGSIVIGEPFKASLFVKNFAAESVQLTGIEANIQGLEASIEPIEEGRTYNIHIALSPSLAKGPFSGKLKIRTSSPKKPVLEVDVRGTVQ